MHIIHNIILFTIINALHAAIHTKKQKQQLLPCNFLIIYNKKCIQITHKYFNLKNKNKNKTNIVYTWYYYSRKLNDLNVLNRFLY